MSEGPGLPQPNESPTKILVVDDHPANILVLRAVLEEWEEHILEAHSGEEALRRLATDEVAVVLLDVQMPGISGFETARRMREQPRLRHTPIIFLTAYDHDRAQLEEGYALGAVDFLAKPLLPAALKAKVATFVELFAERQRARREAEQLRQLMALSESERRFRGFMQHLSGLAWIKDVAGRYIFANDAALKAFGVSQAELYGHTDTEIFPPETAALFRANDRQALEEGRGVQVVETLADPQGVVRHSLVSKFPILGPDGKASLVGGMAIDITDRLEAEEQLRRHKERLELAQQAGRIGAFEWDIPTGRVEWSQTEEEVFGLPAGSFGGTFESWREMVHPEDRERAVADCQRAVAAREDLAMEFRIIRPDGQVRWIAARGKVFCDEAGEPLRMVGVNVDVTERREAIATLKEADRRKDEFLATLAHELRNPLAPIRNSLQILKMPRVDAATAERTREMIERQVQQLIHLVDDLLDVSRVMRGKIELRRERVELASVIARGVETAQPLLDAQDHELTISLPPESLLVDADPLRLTQVVGNLLVNAAKYTEPKGHIALSVAREGPEAVLSIRDDGVGIAPELLPHIFGLFVQADHSTTKAQGGLGIGLTLVKSLVELHQGKVEAKSAGVGRGSEFIVRLPLALGREQIARLAADPERPPPAPGHRLLVVDDNQDAANSLALLLRLYGDDVRAAHDGPAAIELALSFRPRLVFLDIGMPVMDGYEVARRLRAEQSLDGLVLVAVTGWGQPEDRSRSQAAGFDHHVVKPPSPQTLERLLAELR